MPEDSPRLRADIETLPEYKAGQRPQPRTDITTFKISSNESHQSPLPSVVTAITGAITDINRYPDPHSRDLMAAIANHFGVPEEHIALGTGSVALCGQIIASASSVGDEIIYPWRSFEAYPIWTQYAGATSVQVPLLPNEKHDIDAMLAAINDSTRVIFLCSPNNPTGEIVSRAEIDRVIAATPPSVIIVLDEAYTEYVPADLRPDSIALYQQHPNVVVLRTFSKAYGLAGLRVGFTFAQERITGALRKTSLPFGVSSLAQVAAIASLAAEDELLQRVDSVIAERQRVETALAASGWKLHPSYANFIWLRTGPDTARVHAALEAAGLSVRPFPDEGLRVTIAEPEANERLLATLTPLADFPSNWESQ